MTLNELLKSLTSTPTTPRRERGGNGGHSPVTTIQRRSVLSGLVVVLVSVRALAADKPIRILVLGDSLTAGYGLDDLNDAFPAQLERALKAKDPNVSIVPAGVSGDTTTGGLSRLDWSLSTKPDAVIVELG